MIGVARVARRRGVSVALVCASFSLAACTVPKDPCVPAFGEGTYRVTLVERYRAGGAYAFDPGLVGTVGSTEVDCSQRGWPTTGVTLTFRTIGDEGSSGASCRYQIASLVDPPVTGPSELRRAFGTGGWLFRSRDRVMFDGGCHDDVVTSVFLTAGADPFAAPTADQTPPVLMGLSRSSGNAACGACAEFWVITVARVMGAQGS